MAFNTWLLYLIAITGLSLTPGPNGLLAMTHGALYGHRRALWTVMGGVIGFTLLMALSMFGIDSLLKASANALTILKWLGGAYLIWLGIQLWRSPPPSLDPLSDVQAKPARAMFSQGLFAAMSNPKVILFFGAFLPQFLDPTSNLWLQFAVMALTFVVVEAFVEYLLARMAQRIRPWLQRSGKGFNRSCAVMFIAIGSALPMTR
ncbi:LysE family translocator [Pseudomonas sp. EL_65y_Pfl2_R95]|uniref:LysE family translocator n=1 Tax=Pseudomonas sp. EL_65y_Pfl2_R95 TaxID=3088698 RepID=UPI0030DB3DFC